MTGKKVVLILFFLGAFMSLTSAQPRDPAVQQLLDQVGLKPQGDQRGQMDTVGFALRREQMDQVLQQCQALAAPRWEALKQEQSWNDETSFIAGLCPHDDYYYAGRLDALLLPHIQARRVIIFGVFHKARVFGCRNQLVFDAFKSWHGPYGPVAVSSLREEILAKLPREDYIVDNDMQTVEHSVEAIVPFLQAYHRDVEIVSILVPHMDWDTLDSLAADLSNTLMEIVNANHWTLGKDLAFISSCDAVHYGDAGWGGSNFAPFGCDLDGYEKAVEQDVSLAHQLLCGELDRPRLKDFLYSCVDPQDVTKYKLTWCGRFSVPFGLNVVSRVAENLRGQPLNGVLLDYGTSVSEASLDLEGLGGMGATAPNNFHHFVGYAAVGYSQ